MVLRLPSAQEGEYDVGDGSVEGVSGRATGVCHNLQLREREDMNSESKLHSINVSSETKSHGEGVALHG